MAKTNKRRKKPPSFDGYAALVSGARIVFVPRPTLIADDGQLIEVNCPATLIVHGEIGGKVVWHVKREKPRRRK